MAIDKRSIKKLFPHLAKELEKRDSKIGIDSVQGESIDNRQTPPDKLSNFNPTVVDFLRRCDTEMQVESIIAFMEKQGEIRADYAEQLRLQLRRDGIRSFGPKKENDYYFKEGGLC